MVYLTKEALHSRLVMKERERDGEKRKEDFAKSGLWTKGYSFINSQGCKKKKKISVYIML